MNHAAIECRAINHPQLVVIGGHMKTRTIVMTLALCFAATAVGFASNLHMGTWKLNEAKSRFAAGATKNHTVVYEAAGEDVKVIVDGTDANGNAVHHEWTGKFNGKYYPVTGDPSSDERSYRRVSSRVMTLTGRKAGKVTVTGRIVLTANGKRRTITTTVTDANGKRLRNVAVYDKQ
jgi:hypothetical protein